MVLCGVAVDRFTTVTMMHNLAVSIGDPSARPSLTARVVSRASLDETDIAAMFALLSENFLGVDRETFRQDLAEKNWVVLLSDDAGGLRGFSTFLIYATAVAGRPMTVVYSGDTIVEQSAWGSPVLPRAWIRAVYDARREYPDGDLYWLLLTSGFRTYRFVPVFCRLFYPRFDAPTPSHAQRLLDALSTERFGARYDSSRGIVRFPKPQMLRERLVGVPDGRHTDPHVRFFLERNPGHVAGDELVTVTSLASDNLTPAGRRMLR
jgi:hypothetical protein